MTFANAAVYLRSSKDRSDVSIDAQRRELQTLATAKNLTIVAEYADVVESAKDDRRPEFQRLKHDMKAAGRGWNVVLLLDPARLSRNQFVAHLFKHDADRAGVRIVYARMPESNPMVDIIITPIMHAFAEYFSWESKQKGLAGMAENVRRGFRAGGRAPLGYALEHIDTGAVREGKAVTKSHLVPGEHAAAIATYLQRRAAGIPRGQLVGELPFKIAPTSLVGIEWNALTYAGHTIWNVHAERVGGHYRGGAKRRPRSDWVIQRDTHTALITDEEAEVLLARLEGVRARRGPGRNAPYLLTGMLQTPAGEAWHGDGSGRYYRHGSRKMRTDALDRALVAKVMEELRSEAFVQALLRAARKQVATHAPAQELERGRAAVRKLTDKIRRANLAALEAPAPRGFYDLVREFETERAQLEHSLVQLEREAGERTVLSALTERDILRTLTQLAEHLRGVDAEQTKAFLVEIVERVTLDPETLSCRIYYKIPAARGERMASPGQRAAIPSLRIWRVLRLAA